MRKISIILIGVFVAIWQLSTIKISDFDTQFEMHTISKPIQNINIQKDTKKGAIGISSSDRSIGSDQRKYRQSTIIH
ncbi:MAG: hypothetical protein AAFQ94_09895 [Bacteroidota bacterium]